MSTQATGLSTAKLGIATLDTGRNANWLELCKASVACLGIQHVIQPHTCVSPLADLARIGPAFNLAIEKLNTEWVMRLDEDDVLIRGCGGGSVEAIEVLLAALHAEPWCNLDVITVSLVQSDNSLWGDPLNLAALESYNCCAAGCLFRKSLWKRLGGFAGIAYDDWHFWLRAARLKVPTKHWNYDFLYWHRLHRNSLGALTYSKEAHEEFKRGVLSSA